VVFSFDGDAAGRRAAGRALEAALAHATDLRTVRFLFLPAEHDPDSYVRELGAAAFEDQVNKAVPLSRQLIAQASEDLDLQTAEGRARMLAQARPWWSALPDGALKRQLLPELARQAHLETAELAGLWQAAGAPGPPDRRMARGPMSSAAVPLRRSSRRAPAGPADLALRLLLRHSDWWEQLPGEDQALLHRLGGPHGVAVAWLERELTEHGPLPWAALEERLGTEDWAADARGWVRAAAADEEQGLADLQRVLLGLQRDKLEAEAQTLAGQENLERVDLDKLRALHERINQIKRVLAVG
jgi:DNA primase